MQTRDFLNLLKHKFEDFAGREIERFGPRSFALLDRRRRRDAWFSHHFQMRWVIDHAAIDLVVDVGANEGQFVRELRDYYNGEVLSFEPASAPFARLAASAAADPRWRAFNVALGDVNSTATLRVAPDTVFSSLLGTNEYCQQRFGLGASDTHEESVQLCRLDDVLTDSVPDLARRRVLLKLDTQGYNLKVFAGLGRTLSYVRAIQAEVSLIPIYEGMPHWTESLATYERAGFGVVGLFPVTWDSARVIEYDCLLLRVDAQA